MRRRVRSAAIDTERCAASDEAAAHTTESAERAWSDARVSAARRARAEKTPSLIASQCELAWATAVAVKMQRG